MVNSYTDEERKIILEYDTLLKLQQKTYIPWVPAKKTHLKNQTVENKSTQIENIEDFDAKSFYLSLVGIDEKNGTKSDTSNMDSSKGIAAVFDQFRSSDVTPPIVYGLPAENRGFQIMVNSMKWEPERGLGPTEKSQQSRLFPIATQFKTDRTGIGSRTMRKLPKRITHFASKMFDSEGREVIATNSSLIVNNQAKKIQKVKHLLQKKSVVKMMARKERARSNRILNSVLGRDDVPIGN